MELSNVTGTFVEFLHNTLPELEVSTVDDPKTLPWMGTCRCVIEEVTGKRTYIHDNRLKCYSLGYTESEDEQENLMFIAKMTLVFQELYAKHEFVPRAYVRIAKDDPTDSKLVMLNMYFRPTSIPKVDIACEECAKAQFQKVKHEMSQTGHFVEVAAQE